MHNILCSVMIYLTKAKLKLQKQCVETEEAYKVWLHRNSERPGAADQTLLVDHQQVCRPR